MVKNQLFQDHYTCTHSWQGRLTYKLLTATILIYANGAGITMAAGTRLTHFFLAWGDNTACLRMSTCTACTPSWLGALTYELLTATTLIYAYGAGITLAAGTRLTLNYIGHSSITLDHKMSPCTAYTSSGLGD